MCAVNTIPSFDNWLVAVGTIDPTAPNTSIQLDSGRVVSVPTSLLVSEPTSEVLQTPDAESVTIPVLAEELVVGKRQVPLETVRLTRSVETRTESVEIPLLKERWEVTRVPFDTEVPARIGPRQESDTTIYPVVEERVMTRTVLILVEEIHVRKVSEVVSQRIEKTLEREVISVERLTP